MKKKEDKKNKWVSIRVSEAQYNQIQKLKETKLKPSDLLYFALHNITKKDKADLLRAINQIGNNVNQIACKINQDKKITDKEIQQASKELKNVFLKIKDFINYDI